MTDQELDAMLQCILLDVYKQNETQFGDGNTTTAFTASKQHQHQMKMMQADPLKWVARRKKPLWKRRLQNIVAAVLIMVITFGSLMAISPSIRAAVVRWLAEWSSVDVTFSFVDNERVKDMPSYEITSLPDGYFENKDAKVEWPGYVQHIYENKEGCRIYFDYMEMNDSNLSSISTEGSDILPVTVNSYQGYLILSNNLNEQGTSLTWFDSKENLQFTLDAMLSKRELLYVAESVSLVQKDENF